MTVNVPKKTQTASDDLADFERQLKELETLVERMERGDQTLEQSLQDFERGFTLFKACQDALKKAEQRVEMLVKKYEGHTLEPVTPEE
jgi:exodeoxyribonuclease VII small subunit